VSAPRNDESSTGVDALVVGAGFAGMYMIHHLRGLGLTVRGVEAADDVGGTWYWNRYPGARCDVESLHYSYSFSEDLEQYWQWSERFASQSEILRYARHVADRFDLRRSIDFGTIVTGATFEAATCRWFIETDRGPTISTRFLIFATGCLSVPKDPDIQGLADFSGAVYHTARWPHQPVDFTGLQVGVVGTGSSGVQIIPIIAQHAAGVVVFQRTPAFSMPAHNRSLEQDYVRQWKVDYRSHREQARSTGFTDVTFPAGDSALAASQEEREQVYEERWGWGSLTALPGAYRDVLLEQGANDTVAEFIREKIRATVLNPDTARSLLPKDYPFGTKRPCLDSGYYETFNRANVQLVDLRAEPLREVCSDGIATSARFYPLDCLILATGFDAMTGALSKINIRGRTGVSLAEAWGDGPKTYLGLAVAGFPNMFLITGPQSPSVLSNMLVSIEYHVQWVGRCIEHVQRVGASQIEAQLQAQDAWVQHSDQVARTTLYPKAGSWYMGANVPGKPVVMMPYVGGHAMYRQLCDNVADSDYAGFDLR
jgi:cyclohexanone monooxygenase